MRYVLAFAFLAASATSADAQVRTERAFPNLTFDGPLGLVHDGVHPAWRFVVEQRGVIHVVEGTGEDAEAAVFLDIRDRVSAGGEKGLLGLAFDPDYAANGYFYVYYSTPDPHRSRVSRARGDLKDLFPPGSNGFADEEVLLEIAQPYGNHNGGHLAFGPDGYLYVALGDGGSGGDPDENGQDPTTLLGSILRLDVHGGGSAPDCGGAGARYTVPAANALADGPGGACDEIWAYGLRNPWRFSFDRATGQMWLADVGQNLWEEVNVGQNGANYGWNTYEGTRCFDGPCEDPPPAELVFPIWEYAHEEGGHFQGCSITGGYVYRGPAAPELEGRYVYGDYCSGTVWALRTAASGVENEQLEIGPFSGLTSFGEDAAGELYVVQSSGEIHRIVGGAVAVAEPAVPGQGLRLGPAAPNPFADATTLPLHLAAPAPVRVAVYDVLGREVAVLHDGPLPAGDHAVGLDASALAPGLYVVRAEGGGGVRARRVVRAR